jgi:hypothetical protein
VVFRGRLFAGHHGLAPREQAANVGAIKIP